MCSSSKALPSFDAGIEDERTFRLLESMKAQFQITSGGIFPQDYTDGRSSVFIQLTTLDSWSE